MLKKQEKRQPCEVYSRVCGYLQPLQCWNDAKQAEFKDRQFFNLNSQKT
ncbi:anaerobic ribonucleoside-triphosphate reductase [Patescibacteria group bacterium]|nr:anaerobic ribonucleoside-triphosphate reductase [Patescibacteria group bacterium]